MKVLGAVCLHYGKEYLEYALKSIEGHCDEILILYTATPSYGFSTRLKNPDTKQELFSIARKFNKVIWQEIGHSSNEGHHRQIYQAYAKKEKFDLVLVCDSDEVYNPDRLDELLRFAYYSDSYRYAVHGTQWHHFWKSFNEVNRDAFAPIRVLNMNNPIDTQETVHKGEIYHFGYAISDDLMKYKISCHGHKNDFDANKGWNDKWFNYDRSRHKYLHPATDAYWVETEDFDKSILPAFMKDHPLYDQ